MTSELSSREAAAEVTDCPRLRAEVKARPGEAPGVVALSVDGREVEVLELEWELARRMDGRRSTSQLLGDAHELGIPATLESLPKLVRELRKHGLLEAEGALPSKSAAPAAEPTSEWSRDRAERAVRQRRLAWTSSASLAALLLGSLIHYPLRITAPVELRPILRSKVRATVAGVVSRIMKREGEAVRVGDLLGTIEPSEVAATAMAADVQRRAPGLESGPRERLEGPLALERERPTEVRSPIDGIVITPHVEEALGQTVRAGDVVVEVSSFDRMKAEISVPESEMSEISRGQNVVIEVLSYPGRTFTGTVEDIPMSATWIAEEEKAVVRVGTTVSNERLLLRDRMTGWAEIDCGPRPLLGLAVRRVWRWFRVRFLL